jgi:putative two-component system response regulator
MPHLDGYQVLAQLTALGDPLLPPIVILSAHGDRDHLIKALTAGARDFVSKPFDRNELLMRVRNLLDAQVGHRMLYDQKTALDDMVRLRTDALYHSRLQVVLSLGRAAEYRDNETGLHIVRMSKYSALLAKGMGWNASECELMLNASPMHDIGKIGIPDAILLKPGKFDPDEWKIMQTHVTIGAYILHTGDSALLRMARAIALNHHEKWDGTGYPNGLAGTAIAEAARIAAVADVFDALTSERPYKKAWPVADAKRYIEENSGSHFDPEVVAQFMAHQDEMMDIRNQHMEPENAQEHTK